MKNLSSERKVNDINFGLSILMFHNEHFDLSFTQKIAVSYNYEINVQHHTFIFKSPLKILILLYGRLIANCIKQLYQKFPL